MDERQLQAEGAAVVHIVIGIRLSRFGVVKPDRMNVLIGKANHGLAIETVNHVAEQAPTTSVVVVEIKL